MQKIRNQFEEEQLQVKREAHRQLVDATPIPAVVDATPATSAPPIIRPEYKIVHRGIFDMQVALNL